MTHARRAHAALLLSASLAAAWSHAVVSTSDLAAATEIVFRDVRVVDGRSAALSSQTDVLVRGNSIAAIGADAVASRPAASTS